jgi:hypothetical protein
MKMRCEYKPIKGFIDSGKSEYSLASGKQIGVSFENSRDDVVEVGLAVWSPEWKWHNVCHPNIHGNVCERVSTSFLASERVA